MLKRIATASIVLALVATGAALAATHGAGTKVTLHPTTAGRVLATSKGYTLYMYKPDGKNKSKCKGGCASTWPPLLTRGTPVAGKGVRQKLLGMFKRGTKFQVSYNGHPLYTYTGDASPGDANGEGFGGFFTVNAAGNKN